MEIRRFPCWWRHPRDEEGGYVPTIDRTYEEALADYRYSERLWALRRHPIQIMWPERTAGYSHEQWEGQPPDPRYYRRESWQESEADCVALYETLSEGTPLSPPFQDVEDLRQWMLGAGYASYRISDVIRTSLLPVPHSVPDYP